MDELLGMQIRQHKDMSITLSMEHYIERMLDEHGFADIRPAATPAVKNAKGTCETRTDQPYHRLLGQLLWIAGTTRPDIAWAVGKAAGMRWAEGRSQRGEGGWAEEAESGAVGRAERHGRRVARRRGWGYRTPPPLPPGVRNMRAHPKPS